MLVLSMKIKELLTYQAKIFDRQYGPLLYTAKTGF